MLSLTDALFAQWKAFKDFDATKYPGVQAAQEANDKASRARYLAAQGLDTARKSRGAGKQQRITDATLVYESTQTVLEQTNAVLSEVMVEPNRVRHEMGIRLEAALVEAFWLDADIKYVESVGTGVIVKGRSYYEEKEYEAVVADYTDKAGISVWAIDNGRQRIAFRGTGGRDGALSFRVEGLSDTEFMDGSVVPDDDFGMSADVTLESGWSRPWSVSVNWGTMRCDSVAESRRMMEVHKTAVEFAEFLEEVFKPVLGTKD